MPAAPAFICNPLRLAGIKAGQRVFASIWTQIDNTNTAPTSFSMGICWRAAGSTAAPTPFTGTNGAGWLNTLHASNWTQITLSGLNTFAAAGDYDVGSCWTSSPPAGLAAANSRSEAIAFQ
ncbi:MAG TPA: hypothetical protein VF994_12650 [Myxococcales bacterium]